MSIPLTDNEHWNDWIGIISCVAAPPFILFEFDILTIEIADGFEMWHLSILVGTLLSVFTAFRIRQKYKVRRDGTQKLEAIFHIENDTLSECSSQIQLTSSVIKPKLSSSLLKAGPREDSEESESENEAVMKYLFMILGFLSAVAWINVTANELVNILTTLGIVSQIDLAVLGLTVLAWGNSIGDLVADVGVSKKGYPKMGISAAIGGPTLNVLIGIGLGCTIVAIREGSADLPNSPNLFIGCLGVMLGMTIYLLVVATQRWRITRPFGYFLFVYYAMFLAVNLIVYFYPNLLFNFGR